MASLCCIGSLFAQKVTLSGYVKDASNAEELIGVTVYVEELKNGAITNPYGFYSLTLTPGKYTLTYSFIGYKAVKKEVNIEKNTELNIELPVEAIEIEEVVVSAEKEEEDKNIEQVAMSKNDINVEMVKKLPALFGEPDIIKTIQMMPGVVSAGEGTSGFFVRGGSADQNMILIDEAPIYDPSHFFGLFSVFNADVIKDSELYKGGIPSQFGGRLSSILDVRTKDGNAKHLDGSATVGLLASKMTLEGPLAKNKSSFLLSARRSYADLFLKLSNNEDTRSNQVYFYDINAKINWKPNNKNRFFVAAYAGRDVFKFGDDAKFDWGNLTTTFRWNHLYSERLFSNTTVLFSKFDYSLAVFDEANSFDWTANLEEVAAKNDFTFYINPKNILSFGVHATYHRFSPGTIKPASDNSIFTTTTMEKMHAMDYAFYVGNEQTISPKFTVQYGLRYSLFQNVGETTIREYRDQTDNVDIDILDEIRYGKLKPIKTFHNLEPRLSMRYKLTNTSSMKASYNRMVQNIHLLSNSTVPVPFNTWTPSSPYLDPQIADQVALGYFRNFKDNTFEFSSEVYYKEMKNITDFADNANLLLNPNVAVEYRQGTSDSYGLELMVQKNKGRFTGFVSYTLSKTEREIPGLNNNQPFPANYDRRNNLNVVGTLQLNDKWTLGGTFTYTTGRPITLPNGRYEFDGYNVELYSERNGYRLPDFHRLDLSATLTPRKNAQRKWKRTWNFSIYNVYNRKNPFTIYTRTLRDDDGEIIDPNRMEARLVYLFPILPSVSYKIDF